MSSAVGRFGEAWARGYLSRQGYRIVETNVRYRTGEIDIVAIDGEEMVFIEVKTRTGNQFGSPQDAVTHTKLQRLSRAIELYRQAHNLSGEYRLDVLALEIDGHGRIAHVEHLKAVGEGL